MRQSKGMYIWSVIYPVFLYFAVCQIVSIVLLMLPFTAGLDAVKRQLADTAAGLLVLYGSFIRPEGKKRAAGAGRAPGAGTLPEAAARAEAGTPPETAARAEAGTLPETAVRTEAGTLPEAAARTEMKRVITGMIAAALLTGAAGIALNNLFALTGIKQMSESYRAVEQAFYSSDLFWEVLAFCILAPAAEELLYRVIVFDRLRDRLGRWGAVAGSALIFGLMHMNIVQTLYACALGLLLGILMEYYRDVRVTMCGHTAANLCAVLRAETGFLRWLKPGSGSFPAVTLGLLLSVLVFAGLYVRSFKKNAD